MNYAVVRPSERGGWETVGSSRWFIRLSPTRKLEVFIPEGFRFDGNSAKFLPAFTHDYTFSATLVHDWLYYSHKDQHGRVTRREADAAMFELMKQKGAHLIRRWYHWAGVRAFGGGAWARSYMRTDAFAKV